MADPGEISTVSETLVIEHKRVLLSCSDPDHFIKILNLNPEEYIVTTSDICACKLEHTERVLLL